MAGTYSPRLFLHQAPNALLARYFHERHWLLDLNIADLDESDIAPIFGAYEQLPEDIRSHVDADFADIAALATDAGVRALLDEAQSWDDDLEAVFRELDGFHDKAFWAFLERPAYLPVALQFVGAQEFPKSTWTKRIGLPPADEPPDDEQERQALAGEVQACFRPEGRGYFCSVDRYERAGAVWYFACLDNYGENQAEIEKGILLRRSHRPAFTVIFVHAAEQATLDVHHDGPRETVRDLMRAFARAVLRVELPDEPEDERVYDLNRFKRREVAFVYGPDAGIKDIWIVLLKLTDFSGRKYTVQPGKQDGPRGIYDALQAELRSAAAPVPFATMNVVRVGLRVEFVRQPGQRGRPSRTFYLSYPDGCNLAHDGRDAMLRQMLIDSQIERRPERPAPA
jgi:hypothetical protein